MATVLNHKRRRMMKFIEPVVRYAIAIVVGLCLAGIILASR